MKSFMERRNALGITQAQLAKILGVSQARISAIETGTSRMGKGLRVRWMQALGMEDGPNVKRSTLMASLTRNAQYLTDEQLVCIEDIVKYLARRR